MALPRLLELYCGIGGCAAAVEGLATVSAALDVNTVALGVYRHNFAHPASACALESLRADDPRLRDADVWWMSPPCQPYTRRGNRRDLDDPRSKSFLHVLELVDRLRPPALALENVPEMRGSEGHARLCEVLDRAGYEVAERVLCPTELGVPNRRRRFYLVASREGLTGWAGSSGGSMALAAGADSPSTTPLPWPPLATFLDADDSPELRVGPELIAAYEHAVDIVEADDPNAVAATFTSAYGRSPVRAGSYLRRNGIVRRFSPNEILRLLGFPASYRLPANLSLANTWRLLGNSLSVLAVREIVSALALATRIASDEWEPFAL